MISTCIRHTSVVILVGLVCFFAGYATCIASIHDAMAKNTARIKVLERAVLDMNSRLDTLPVGVQ